MQKVISTKSEKFWSLYIKYLVYDNEKIIFRSLKQKIIFIEYREIRSLRRDDRKTGSFFRIVNKYQCSFYWKSLIFRRCKVTGKNLIKLAKKLIAPSRNEKECQQFKRALQTYYDTKTYFSLPVLIPFQRKNGTIQRQKYEV